MPSYATAQHTGDRSHQCAAAAVSTSREGVRAHVLLDGGGDSAEVRERTVTAARRLARAAARSGDGEQALRRLHTAHRAERAGAGPRPHQDLPGTRALVAVTVPGRPLLTVAWCGDVRAYRMDEDRQVHLLTLDEDPNRDHPCDASCPDSTGDGARAHRGHRAVGTATAPAAGRLVLMTHGAYDPHQQVRHPLDDLLTGTPAQAATALVHTAVHRSYTVARFEHRRPCADNATALVADLRP
ncbi:mucin-2 [Streptacidiphilus sp. EB103A]|uniref:mucin-2 n=1 Tax=Streptacidiphilus sp. EB103A TaxID=3156275 RepID=UPI003518A9BF